MKKVLLGLLSLMLVTGILIGCAAPAPAPSLKPAPTPTPTPAPAPAEPIKLKFAHGAPAVDTTQVEVFTPWAKMVEERTKVIGKPVQITFFPGGALGPKADHYDLCIKGVCDIVGNWGVHEMPGRFPLGEYAAMPWLFPSSIVAGQTMQDIYDKYPAIQKELSQTKLLWFGPTSAQTIGIRDKQIKSLEDFKGQKWWVQGGVKSKAVQALGSVPVAFGLMDVYSSLEKGGVDIVSIDWGGMYAFKWHEVTKWRVLFPGGWSLAPTTVSMNLDSWNKLPKDVQAIFTELSGMYMTKLSSDVMDKAATNAFEMIKVNDKKIGNPEPYTIPNSDYQRWVEATNPVFEEWVAGLEAKGLPAKALLADVRSLVKQYSAK